MIAGNRAFCQLCEFEKAYRGVSKRTADRDHLFRAWRAATGTDDRDPRSSFSVSPVHIKVTDQKTYEDRHKPDIVYAEWTASEKDGGIVVTRIEYGYLKNGEGE